MVNQSSAITIIQAVSLIRHKKKNSFSVQTKPLNQKQQFVS